MTKSQTISILKEVETSILIKDVYSKHNIGNFILYKWREQYNGTEASDGKRLKEPEEE